MKASSPIHVPDHELLRPIDSGSYGQVWLARNLIGTWRAVKIIDRDNFDHDRPFEREFHGLEQYEPISRSHPGLVNILQVGRSPDDRQIYYVMELADDANRPDEASGQPSSIDSYAPRTLLQEMRNRGSLPPDECIEIGWALADALRHLHEHGLVHRDIKPSNIIFVDDHPKLADIGSVANISSARSLVGTEGFNPPEGPGTPQGDFYSFGKVLYEMSTGKDRQEFPALPTRLREDVNHARALELNEIIIKACAHDPRRRYRSAKALLDDLDLLQKGRSVKRMRILERRLTLARRIGLVGALGLALVSGALYQANLRKSAAQKHLATLHVAEGGRLLQKDDLIGALVHFTEAFRHEESDSSRETNHRVRLATTFQHCPKPVAFLAGSGGPVVGLAIHPGGSHLLTFAEDSNVKVWDLASDTFAHSLEHDTQVLQASFSSDGRWILTQTLDGQAWVWDPLTGQRIGEPVPHSHFLTDPNYYAVDLDEDYIAGMKNVTSIFAHKKPTGFPRNLEDTRVTLSLRGERAAVRVRIKVEDRGSTNIFYKHEFHDTEAEEPFESGQDDPPNSYINQSGYFLFGTLHSPIDKAVLSSTLTCDAIWVRIADSASETNLIRNDFKDEDSPDWTLLGSGSASVTNAHLTLSSSNFLYAFDPRHRIHLQEGRTVELGLDVVGTDNAEADVFLAIVFYDPLKSREAIQPRLHSASGRMLVLDRWSSARIWDINTNGFVSSLTNINPRVQACFSKDGQQVVTVTDRGAVRLTSVDSGEEVLPPTSQLSTYTGHTHKVALGPKGRWLATLDEDNLARIWQLPNGELNYELPHEMPLTDLMFSPEGYRLVTASNDKTARVWDVNTGQILTGPLEHPRALKRCLFSPDGRLVITWSTDEAVRFWDSDTGRPALPGIKNIADPSLFSLAGHGRLLAALHRDGAVRVWDLSKPASLSLPIRYYSRKSRVSASHNGRWTATVEENSIQLGVRSSRGFSSLVNLENSRPLRKAMFANDGAYLVNETIDGLAQVWDTTFGEPLTPFLNSHYVLRDAALLPIEFQAAERPWQEWEAISHLLAGIRLGGGGRWNFLEPAELTHTWNRLRRTKEFSSSKDEIRDWHLRAAASSEQAWDWSAAVFHLDKLLNPANDELRARFHYAQLAQAAVQQAPNYTELRQVTPPRPPRAGPAQLDLSSHYNRSLKAPLDDNPASAFFATVPSGLQTFAGIQFDVRGAIRLEATNHVIRLGRTCRQFHFLHTVLDGRRWGLKVADYVIHYVDGTKHPLEVQAQIAVGDALNIWLARFYDAKLAWLGRIPSTRSGADSCRLYVRTWENPFPDLVVASIELVPSQTRASPLVVAITVE